MLNKVHILEVNPIYMKVCLCVLLTFLMQEAFVINRPTGRPNGHRVHDKQKQESLVAETRGVRAELLELS